MSLRYLRVLRLHPSCPGTHGAPDFKRAAVAPEPFNPASGLVIDRDRRAVGIDGASVRLTYREFELLVHLVAHPRRVHSRGQLMNAVWGQPAIGDLRTIDVHIARLRRKLGPVHASAITTVRQIGYSYVPESAVLRAA
ncbi:winged helix-turn-helix domain-containing protein [Streptomyces sp. NPDC050516]|uniref:winged helix-turn-helix domain-containing protein n=1 Tax=Streptomyces sp. NPDC050516 TaxID=3365621 RepID=UPI0037AE1DE5